MDNLLAAGVKGHSLPAFRFLADPQVMQLQGGKNPKNKLKALQEEAIRRKFGTWGIPGAVPVDPVIG
jgi:hypothetical protein